MKTLIAALFFVVSIAHSQNISGDGTRDNPRRGQSAPPEPAIVLYQEIRTQKEGQIPAAQLEARLKKLIPGGKKNAEWEATMGHQLSMLSALVKTKGDVHLSIDLARAAIEYYEDAEDTLSRGHGNTKHRARMAGHIAYLQDVYLAEPEVARQNYARAIQLDPDHEEAKKRHGKLTQDKQTKKKPQKGGRG